MKAKSNAPRPRRQPVQSRSKQTLDWILEAAARVFRAEGFDATTNRIAAAAGVSVGSLYEYFPNKDALLLALAERHVTAAEDGVADVLARSAPTTELLAALQAAIVASHRYPSQALDRVSDPKAPELRLRALRLRERVLDALLARARLSGLPDPALRARTAFALIGELSSQTGYELAPAEHARMLQHLLKLAVDHLA